MPGVAPAVERQTHPQDQGLLGSVGFPGGRETCDGEAEGEAGVEEGPGVGGEAAAGQPQVHKGLQGTVYYKLDEAFDRSLLFMKNTTTTTKTCNAF